MSWLDKTRGRLIAGQTPLQLLSDSNLINEFSTELLGERLVIRVVLHDELDHLHSVIHVFLAKDHAYVLLVEDFEQLACVSLVLLPVKSEEVPDIFARFNLSELRDNCFLRVPFTQMTDQFKSVARELSVLPNQFQQLILLLDLF